jgi:serine/threonine protein phosphatase PrpC
VDMSFSGSTVICCYFIKDKLYCCNVGDSRAIMGKCKKNSDKDKSAVW